MTRILLPLGGPCGSALSGSERQPDGTWRNYVDVPDEALEAAGWARFAPYPDRIIECTCETTSGCTKHPDRYQPKSEEEPHG